jgi:hypothetical protein
MTRRRSRHLEKRGRIAIAGVALLAACGGGDPGIDVGPTGPTTPNTPTTPTTPGTGPAAMSSLGLGAVTNRFTAEVWVRGTTAYTTTWGNRAGTPGNAILVWDVAETLPRLVNTVLVDAATTVGDVQVSDDGTLLLAAIEANPNGGVALYALDTPRTPRLLVRTTGGELRFGVHTAELARVNGVPYAFCAVDPANGVPARLVILDLADPSAPRTVFSQVMGSPFIHDVFVRDGWLFTAEWNDGVGIWDIGAQSGSPAAPRFVARAPTVGGKVHNIWWLHDPATALKRFLLVGEEGPGVIGSSSVGDLHVVDIATPTAPVEVAAYTVPGAGAHNISVDEARGFAYVAFYNGGVRVLDVRGDLSECTAAQRRPDGRCDLTRMGREVAAFQPASPPLFVWGVHAVDGAVYASDMLNGLWVLRGVQR